MAQNVQPLINGIIDNFLAFILLYRTGFPDIRTFKYYHPCLFNQGNSVDGQVLNPINDFIFFAIIVVGLILAPVQHAVFTVNDEVLLTALKWLHVK